MNEYLNFWRTWTKKEVNFLFFCGLVLILLLAYLAYAYFLGLENILHWDVLSEMNEKTISTNFFNDGNIQFSNSSPIWYIKEHYLPSLVKINTSAYYVLFFSGLLGLVLILIGTSRLTGLWFLVGALAIAGFLVSLRLENPFLANNSMAFLVAFLVMGLLYYCSNVYQNKFATYQIFGLWCLGVLVLIAILLKFTVINKPLLSISAYGFWAALVITCLFIFLISHEILAGLVWLVSKNSDKGKSSLLQFFVVAAIYLANVLLIYFERIKIMEASTFIVHPLVLYITSLILGIWGFKKIVEQREWFSFNKSGVWMYSGMAIAATGTFAFAYATSNDSLIELLEDMVAFSQLAMGVCFFVFVLINYFQLFKNGLDVQKVLYKAPFSRLILSRIAAVFLVGFLFSVNNYYSFFQANAAYNDAVADFYLEEGDLKSAETFYKVSTHYQLYNHKANVTLAALALSQKDRINAAFFFKQANQQNASAFSYAGLSASLETENMFFDALFALQEGIQKFPEESKLITNLAYLQGKSKLTDSVLINLDKAQKSCKDCSVENSNFLAFWIENSKPDKLQEMAKLVKPVDSYSFKANRSAIDKILQIPSSFEKFDFGKDSVLDVSKAAYLLNAIGDPKCENKTQVNGKTFRGLQQIQSNDQFFEELSWAFAAQNYYRQNKLEGLKQLTLLANADLKNKAIYNQNLGLWLLKEGAIQEGMERLKVAGDSTSAKLLDSETYRKTLQVTLQDQARELLKEKLTLTNYQSVVNKAPLNPYLLRSVSDFLSEQKKSLEAYNTLFYASEINTSSPIIWKAYIKKALDLSQFEYAEEGLSRLKDLVPAEEYVVFLDEYNKTKQARNLQGFN
jgi:hypothetical protein